MERIARFEKVSYDEFAKSVKLSEAECKNIYENIKLPARGTSGSAGYDFFAPFEINLKPGESINIPTGIRVKINDGWFLAIFPRSGLGFKYRLQLNNTVGIIDSDYYFSDNEGHIFCKMTNCTNEGKTVCVPVGKGFCQGIFLPYGITVDDRCENERNGGFGSTDKIKYNRKKGKINRI